MLNEFAIPSFAKINLVLRVLGRRRDGYHRLFTVYQSVSLHDTMHFRFSDAKNFHLILDFGDSTIPADHTNLVYRACHAFHEVHPLHTRIEVRIEKRIPPQSGLGGGSSNAACTLIALSRYLGWPVRKSVLLSMARKLGADVPFFLYGGTALGTNKGDRIRMLEDWVPVKVLLVHPDISCSTPEIYRAFDEADLLTQSSNFIKIHVGRRPESLRDLISRIENDLEKVVFALYPDLGTIQKKLAELGAEKAALTGSGSTVFGIFETDANLEKAFSFFPAATKVSFVSRSEYRRSLGI